MFFIESRALFPLYIIVKFSSFPRRPKEKLIFASWKLGVEEIVTDKEKHKVIVKGENVDILKVLERLRKKYSKNVELISPELPKTEKKEEQEKKEVWYFYQHFLLLCITS